MDNSRRDFIKKTAVTGVAILAAPAMAGSQIRDGKKMAPEQIIPFKLKYAPGLGMFREHAGSDPVDNIRFCHENGFRAMFDNDLMKKPAGDQERIANEINRL